MRKIRKIFFLFPTLALPSVVCARAFTEAHIFRKPILIESTPHAGYVKNSSTEAPFPLFLEKPSIISLPAGCLKQLSPAGSFFLPPDERLSWFIQRIRIP